MEKDILKEIKSLNNSLKKRLFCIKKGQHPRPLQVAIIEYLYSHRAEATYQKNLEEEFNITKSAISDVLNSMEKNNMIERIQSREDARKNRIILTEQTILQRKNIKKDLNQINEEIKEGLTDGEIELFLKITNKIKHNLNKEDE